MSRGFYWLGLLYAAIPVQACVYDAYEVAATELERQHAINWLTIFVPRLSLGLILAFMVYGLFWVAGSSSASPRRPFSTTHLAVHHIDRALGTWI